MTSEKYISSVLQENKIINSQMKESEHHSAAEWCSAAVDMFDLSEHV